MEKVTMSLPMVALRGMTILPEMVRHFDVSREKSLAAIAEAMEGEQMLFVSAQKDVTTEDPELEDVYETGCIVTVRQIVKMPKKISRVLITGERRAKIRSLEFKEPYLRALVDVVDDVDTSDEETGGETKPLNKEAMLRGLRDIFKEYMLKNPKISKEFAGQIDEINDLKKLVDTVGANLPLSYTEYQELLEETHVMRRYDMLAYKVVNEIQVQNIKEELQEKIRERVDKNQREYILREEMKLIREELGDDNTLSDADEFKQACDALKAPKEVKEKIEKEIKRFKNSMGNPAESGVTRTYIETMLEMPWDKVCKDHKDIAYAEQVLNEDHYGLEKVKERILEFLAVRALTKKGSAPILCLVGPPGTGKTSIAKSLAKALKKPYVRISLGGVRDEAEIRGHRKTYVGAMPGRIAAATSIAKSLAKALKKPYVRISLGGVRDEAEIRGHRKTYVGAMPGRIAAALRSAGVKNPLMLLDEIDKVSNDYKGDTFSALLEVLDSEQNKKFRDHYLEVPLDLSEVLFVTTANTLQTIPRPLLDRMEVIEISSYTENEKLHIATEHLIPKQLAKNGLKPEQLTISKKAIWKIARNYTKEAGVRQLERKISDICRKSAREILEEKKSVIHVTERNLHLYLGKELYIYQMKNEQDEVGIVRGLAWTSVGGDTLEIEVNVMPGEGEILLTGQLGDVMKESARTGISYIRSVSKEYGIDEKFFKEHDIHIHIPEGATPKDGPSAGITMATAMLSAITEKKVRADIAMTGEITLRGRVLPIGGLKEKLLAAKNAGIKTVLVPKENETDVEEISAEITKGLEILPVSYMSEVLKHALIF